MDRRWDDLVNRHPLASAFHQRGWLQALWLTYGYEPCVLTSASAGEPLTDGVVFCRVSSWITGIRLVSLPFADHCEPLLNHESEFPEFVDYLQAECDRRHWKYVEIRPLLGNSQRNDGLQPSSSYWAHDLDTKPGLEQILRRLHELFSKKNPPSPN